mgnify:CR=1 FL=1
MKMYKEGIKVKELIEILKVLPQDKLFVVASDEEQNEVFKGVYLEHYKNYILIAGLSGCEMLTKVKSIGGV